MTLWRISNHADLSGKGGKRKGGRWHSRGRPVTYLTSSPAAALLEMLVHHVRRGNLPADYQWLEITAPSDFNVQRCGELPPNWRTDYGATRALGDAWLKQHTTPLLEVPSVIVPKTSNYLLNPRHADASTLRISSVIRYPLERRLTVQG
ncbi:MAG: RES domain-containing protein [Luteitalea sp.]|nr:RES domain-containing protein [Luteitalea sp.]